MKITRTMKLLLIFILGCIIIGYIVCKMNNKVIEGLTSAADVAKGDYLSIPNNSTNQIKDYNGRFVGDIITYMWRSHAEDSGDSSPKKYKIYIFKDSGSGVTWPNYWGGDFNKGNPYTQIISYADKFTANKANKGYLGPVLSHVTQKQWSPGGKSIWKWMDFSSIYEKTGEIYYNIRSNSYHDFGPGPIISWNPITRAIYVGDPLIGPENMGTTYYRSIDYNEINFSASKSLRAARKYSLSVSRSPQTIHKWLSMVIYSDMNDKKLGSNSQVLPYQTKKIRVDRTAQSNKWVKSIYLSQGWSFSDASRKSDNMYINKLNLSVLLHGGLIKDNETNVINYKTGTDFTSLEAKAKENIYNSNLLIYYVNRPYSILDQMLWINKITDDLLKKSWSNVKLDGYATNVNAASGTTTTTDAPGLPWNNKDNNENIKDKRLPFYIFKNITLVGVPTLVKFPVTDGTNQKKVQAKIIAQYQEMINQTQDTDNWVKDFLYVKLDAVPIQTGKTFKINHGGSFKYIKISNEAKFTHTSNSTFATPSIFIMKNTNTYLKTVRTNTIKHDILKTYDGKFWTRKIYNIENIIAWCKTYKKGASLPYLDLLQDPNWGTPVAGADSYSEKQDKRYINVIDYKKLYNVFLKVGKPGTTSTEKKFWGIRSMNEPLKSADYLERNSVQSKTLYIPDIKVKSTIKALPHFKLINKQIVKDIFAHAIETETGCVASFHYYKIDQYKLSDGVDFEPSGLTYGADNRYKKYARAGIMPNGVKYDTTAAARNKLLILFYTDASTKKNYLIILKKMTKAEVLSEVKSFVSGDCTSYNDVRDAYYRTINKNFCRDLKWGQGTQIPDADWTKKYIKITKSVDVPKLLPPDTIKFDGKQFNILSTKCTSITSAGRKEEEVSYKLYQHSGEVIILKNKTTNEYINGVKYNSTQLSRDKFKEKLLTEFKNTSTTMTTENLRPKFWNESIVAAIRAGDKGNAKSKLKDIVNSNFIEKTVIGSLIDSFKNTEIRHVTKKLAGRSNQYEILLSEALWKKFNFVYDSKILKDIRIVLNFDADTIIPQQFKNFFTLESELTEYNNDGTTASRKGSIDFSKLKLKPVSPYTCGDIDDTAFTSDSNGASTGKSIKIKYKREKNSQINNNLKYSAAFSCLGYNVTYTEKMADCVSTVNTSSIVNKCGASPAIMQGNLKWKILNEKCINNEKTYIDPVDTNKGWGWSTNTKKLQRDCSDVDKKNTLYTKAIDNLSNKIDNQERKVNNLQDITNKQGDNTRLIYYIMKIKNRLDQIILKSNTNYKPNYHLDVDSAIPGIILDESGKSLFLEITAQIDNEAARTPPTISNKVEIIKKIRDLFYNSSGSEINFLKEAAKAAAAAAVTGATESVEISNNKQVNANMHKFLVFFLKKAKSYEVIEFENIHKNFKDQSILNKGFLETDKSLKMSIETGKKLSDAGDTLIKNQIFKHKMGDEKNAEIKGTSHARHRKQIERDEEYWKEYFKRTDVSIPDMKDDRKKLIINQLMPNKNIINAAPPELNRILEDWVKINVQSRYKDLTTPFLNTIHDSINKFSYQTGTSTRPTPSNIRIKKPSTSSTSPTKPISSSYGSYSDFTTFN